jgi:hypothetical protein
VPGVLRHPGHEGGVCCPADPEAKGLVERANGYLETSFLPRRRFASPADLNAQPAEWTATVNGRVRRALGCAPADRIAADRHAMLGLPPVAPETGWGASLRLPATTTSARTPTTTPFTRPPSADAHGGEGRIRAARFPPRKSLEEEFPGTLGGPS